MCGICGFVSKRNITLNELKHMNNTMYHRGPDDSGEEIFPWVDGYAVGLAQRRLSILDLSELGHQPMHSSNGRISVVFNGEIYNFQELKRELSDYSFISTCDTEVIIAGYLKWGIDFVNRIRGMFAIAIFDREDEILYLIRDRIGKKPLYYWYQDENLVFGSELKTIMACPGFEKSIRTEILARYLYHQYINAPDSIFRNVYKLEPGSVLKFKKGEVKVFKYWDVKEVYAHKKCTCKLDYEDAKEQLKELLREAVKERMVADVPVGTFLSGGYDSSLITAIAQEVSSEPVKSFSIGFNEEKFNEAKYAKEVAKHIGTNHTELYIDEKMMFDLVESIPKYYDEPFADSSQIPSMLVADLAKKDVTVVLSGDGGDEFFCGYNAYEKVGLLQKLDMGGGLAYHFMQAPGIRRLQLLKKLPNKITIVALNRDKETKTQFGAQGYFELVNNLVLGEQIPERYPFESVYKERNWQERRMLLDMDTYLPGDILCKVDRATMKYSLEARCPILDQKIMEFAYSIPHIYKIKSGNKKRILKDLAYDYIPKKLLDRPKVGFAIPLDKWLRGPLCEQLRATCEKDFVVRQGIFNFETLNSIVNYQLTVGDKGPQTGENYSRFLWAYFVFQKWYEYYMK